MTGNDQTDELRRQLSNVLAEENLDYGRIIELSHRLAKQDPDNVRFSTDAAIVEKLGRELVSRQETAVAELIKNGYDADATRVELVFKDAREPGGTLSVEDNGNGMTKDELIDGFMRLSSLDKVREPVSPRYNRQRAGKKGIGRFAAQRLGSKLVVTTQTEEEESAWRVSINWDDFEGGRDLGTIANQVQLLENGRDLGKGTTLRIEDLRDGWTAATMRRVLRYVSDLIQPLPLSKESNDNDIDPGFKVNIFREGQEDIEVVADEESLVYDNALALIEGEVENSGQGSWSVRSEKLDIERETSKVGRNREAPEEPFENLRNVKFRAHYFIYGQKFIPKLARKKIRELAKERGGIRIYRNGFRVPPYGEPDNDWLGLDKSTRARRILPPHGNINFFGFVEIIDPEGEQFEETSSREGLINNVSFEELQDFVYRSLRGAVLRIAEARGRKKRSSQQDWEPEEKTASEELEDSATRLAEVAEQAAIGEDPAAAEAELRDEVRAESERVRARAEKQRQREQVQLEEMEMLRVLASLGTAIAEFVHELRAPLSAARTDAATLTDSLPPGSDEEAAARDLLANIDNFKVYASYFDEAVSANTQRDLEVQDLVPVIEDFVDAVEPLADRAGIRIEHEFEGFDLYTVPMHPSEWRSILFNLFSNSRKAIARTQREGRVLIRAGRSAETIYLEFADNGYGIPEDARTRIFQAFYTTTGPASRHADDAEELRGSGLGLSIVSDMVEGYNGTIKIIEPPSDYKTCFRIEIGAAPLGETDQP